MAKYQRDEHTNVHRGVSTLSQEATDHFEAAREKVRRFIGAGSIREIVWTRGTTEAINLVAQTFGRMVVKEGDEILLSAMEHHANIVPWQMLAEEKGATHQGHPHDRRGRADPGIAWTSLLTDRTRILGVTHVCNVLGTINPVKEIIARAHARGVPVLVDGAQAVPHLPVDVTDLDADFYVFSGHKLSGPTGIGVLYGKLANSGGHAALAGRRQHDPFRDLGEDHLRRPARASSRRARRPSPPPSAWATAIDYLTALGLDRIAAHEHDLLVYATERLTRIPGLRILGTGQGARPACMSFVLEGIHPHDMGSHPGS